MRPKVVLAVGIVILLIAMTFFSLHPIDELIPPKDKAPKKEVLESEKSVQLPKDYSWERVYLQDVEPTRPSNTTFKTTRLLLDVVLNPVGGTKSVYAEITNETLSKFPILVDAIRVSNLRYIAWRDRCKGPRERLPIDCFGERPPQEKMHEIRFTNQTRWVFLVSYLGADIDLTLEEFVNLKKLLNPVSAWKRTVDIGDYTKEYSFGYATAISYNNTKYVATLVIVWNHLEAQNVTFVSGILNVTKLPVGQTSIPTNRLLSDADLRTIQKSRN